MCGTKRARVRSESAAPSRSTSILYVPILQSTKTGTSEFWVGGGAFFQSVLETSGATVEVTINLATWNFAIEDVPTAGTTGWEWWHVFDLETDSDGGVEVVPVMRYANEYPPDSIWPDADNHD